MRTQTDRPFRWEAWTNVLGWTGLVLIALVEARHRKWTTLKELHDVLERHPRATRDASTWKHEVRKALRTNPELFSRGKDGRWRTQPDAGPIWLSMRFEGQSRWRNELRKKRKR
jgi:hypothetical protein